MAMLMAWAVISTSGSLLTGAGHPAILQATATRTDSALIQGI